MNKGELVALVLGLIGALVMFWSAVKDTSFGALANRHLAVVSEQLDARIKSFESLLKTNWELSDYPVRFREQSAPSDGKVPRWSAQIVNWWTMIGFGGTKAQAYAHLQQNFDKYKNGAVKLPRPGVEARIQFGSTTQIEKYDITANEFFNRILHRNYRHCFVSDQSCLSDFRLPSERADSFEKVIYQKIRQIYGCDVSDVKDGNLLNIFRKLESLKSRRGQVFNPSEAQNK
jgi:hypothetical protein